MNVFLSYASEQRPLAEDLCHRLQAAGHEVFFDREDLPAGRSYDEHIFQAIAACELFVFLVTPESVAAGRYTRTELKIASRRWPTPGWHVLPVLAAPTPLDSVPSYLRALKLFEAEGNLVAEVLFEVQARAQAAGVADAGPGAPGAPGGPGGPGGRPPPAGAGGTAAQADGAAAGDAVTPRYRSLPLRFARETGGRYRVTLDGPEAAGAAATLAIDAPALEQRLWQGAAAIDGPARRGAPPALPASPLPAAGAVREAGAALYALLFGSPLGPTLRERLRAVDPQRGAGLRLVLDTTDAPELARLPWELLYSPQDEDFVFADRFKPLVRRLSLDAAPPALAVAPPLRLLVAMATPADRPELQVGAELAHLDEALASLAAGGRLQTERLAHATLERLDDALLRWRPHLLHFIGHGDFDGDEGVLLLEAEGAGPSAAGRAAPIAGHRLALLLRNHLDSLRLVFLNSCLGAAAAPRAAFGGVAQSLVRRGMPAVVAMQFPVPDAQAVGLARHFYRYVAAGQPVDAALTSARAFMVARGDDVGWAAPVLYLNAEDGRLFDVAPPAMAEPSAAVKVVEHAEEAEEAEEAYARSAPPVPPGPATGAPSLRAPVQGAPGEAAPAARASRVGLLVGLLLLLLVGGALWLLVGGDEASAPSPAPVVVPAAPDAPPVGEPPPAAQRPAPDLPPVTEPLPAPAPPPASPPPPPPAAPAPPSLPPGATLPPPASPATPAPQPAPAAETVDAARAQLRAGDAAGAALALQSLLARDPQALSAQALGPAHGAVAAELLRGAEAALARGDEASAFALVTIAEQMASSDAAIQAELQAVLGALAATVQPAAGPVSGPGAGAGAGPVEHGSGWLLRVRPGDTLWGLAARFLGDGRRWTVIWQTQQARAELGQGAPLPDPDRLRVGRTIWVPRDDPGGAPGLSLRVAPGDSLWRIAERVYGDGRRWPLIAEANGLAEPDRLAVGQRLVLRPAP